MKLKLIASIMLILLTCLNVFAQTFSQVKSSNLTGYGNYHPQIEIANDNKPLMLWTSSNDKNVYIVKHNENGFETPIQLNPAGLEVQSYNWSGPDLATWGDNVYVVFKSIGYETGKCYLVKSTDNGSTFGDTVRVDNLSTGFAQYPDVAVYHDTVFVTFMDHADGGSDPQYVVARSVDGGATFQTEVLAGELLGNEACECCQPEIVVNEKYVIIFFRNNANNIRDIKAVISTDRGVTFNNWISVDDHQWYITSCPSTGPDARITDDNRILTTYRSYENGDERVFFNEFNLDTETSILTKEISSSNSPNSNYPQIALDGDNIGLVWEAWGNSTDIQFIGSRIGVSGIDSSAAINITDTTGVQSKPDIAYDGSDFHIVYSNWGNLRYIKMSDQSTSLEDVNVKDPFYISPNPNNGLFYINFGDIGTNAKVSVANSLGQVILSSSVTNLANKNEVDISSFPSGTYTVEIQIGVDVTSKKIVKF